MSISTQNRRPLSRRTKVAATTALASIALVGGTAGAASAATGYLAPGHSTSIGTNVIGNTKICVYNYGPTYGQVTFSAPGSSPETNTILPYRTYCKSAWWWGYNVTLTNHGPTAVYSTAYYGWW
jgi:hypothetical protein